MGYERIQKPEGLLYHYTRKENLESILRDGRIRKFCDRETWFTKSLADTLRLMSLTEANVDTRGTANVNLNFNYNEGKFESFAGIGLKTQHVPGGTA